MDFIPNLHNDVAWQCIMRVPYDEFSNAANVAKKWKVEIQGANFHKIRRSVGVTQPAIVVVQGIEDLEESKFRVRGYNPPMPHHLAIWNLKTGRWSNLPPVPWLTDGMPPSCRIAGVGTELVVIGGIDEYENILDSVFIYNFVSSEWRRGAPMPHQRVHFGCASDSDKMVYVAGGIDTDSNSTKNLMVYDVAEDRWTELPDMAKERYTCQILISGGKLQLIDDIWTWYDHPVQREIEIFYIDKSLWGPMLSDCTIDMGIYVDGDNGRIYKCDKEKITVKKDGNWEIIFKFPKPMNQLYFATMWEKKLIIIGSVEYLFSEKGYEICDKFEFTEDKLWIETYALDMENKSWKKLDTLPECVRHIVDSCYLEI